MARHTAESGEQPLKGGIMTRLQVVKAVATGIFVGAFGWVVFNVAVQVRLWLILGR